MKTTKKKIRLPRRVIALGPCVEVCFRDGRVWKPGRRMIWLCSSESGRTLWILPVSAEDRKRVPRSKLYERFHGYEAHGVRIARVQDTKPLIDFGEVKSITYRSRKWGDNASYIHTFKKYPKAYSDSTKSPSLVKISGGKIRVKPEGITG